MSPLADLLSDLEALYAELPDVPCIACGTCCVTPHITAVELAYLLSGLGKDPAALKALVAGKMVKSERYQGNFLCRAQDDAGRCTVHPFRPLACRLEGMPILDEMGMRDEPVCEHIRPGDMEEVTREQIEGWIQAAFDLSAQVHPVSEEPWFVNGLNLECWWAVLFDPEITQPFFLQIRTTFREAYDLEDVAQSYTDRTGFARKLALIETYFEMIEAKRPDKAFRLMRQVLQEFPRTGSHYALEGRTYLRFAKDLMRGRQNKGGN